MRMVPALGRSRPDDQTADRGLAAAAFTDNAEDLALANLEGRRFHRVEARTLQPRKPRAA